MDNLGTYATLLLSVITLATAAGVGFQRGKIARLRGELIESDARADRLAAELSDTQHQLGACRTDLDALGRVVTGEAHWTAIALQLDTHHAAASTHWTAQTEALDRIAQLLERRLS